MKMPKNVDLSKSINREKVIEPSIANNEKNIECPPLVFILTGAATTQYLCTAVTTTLCSRTDVPNSVFIYSFKKISTV